MRRNNTKKPSKDRYDHVYIDMPQCAWLSDIVVDPLKTVYHNRAADHDANVVRIIRDVDDLGAFMWRFNVELF
jgi:hypothetical protein